MTQRCFLVLLQHVCKKKKEKDSYNREKGVRRLEKAYRNGRLSKENINRRGYNKFLEMKNKVEVSINYGKIEAHICICFVALKVYKELDRILKLNGIKLSIDMAKTVTTIQVRLPLNGQLLSRTMVMKRHKPIEKLFDENFRVTQ